MKHERQRLVILETLGWKLGWKYWHEEVETLLLPPGTSWPALPHWRKRGLGPGDGRPKSPLVDTSDAPAFLGDANAALDLCNRLAKEGWHCELSNGLDTTWECTFWRFQNDVPKDLRGNREGRETEEHYGPGGTFCEAVCQAYLHVVGKWEESE